MKIQINKLRFKNKNSIQFNSYFILSLLTCPKMRYSISITINSRLLLHTRTHFFTIFKIIKMLTIIYGAREKQQAIKSHWMPHFGAFVALHMGFTKCEFIEKWIHKISFLFANSLREMHTRHTKYLAWNHLIFIRFKTHSHFWFAFRVFFFGTQYIANRTR